MAAEAAAAHLRRLKPLRHSLAALQARTARWVRRRQGEDQLPVQLQRRRLYILPTRGGVAFGALVFVMLLAGLNYTNSLALFLTFLLAAFGLVVMQLCHRNLLGVRVTALNAPGVFAGRPATLLVTLGNDRAPCRACAWRRALKAHRVQPRRPRRALRRAAGDRRSPRTRAG